MPSFGGAQGGFSNFGNSGFQTGNAQSGFGSLGAGSGFGTSNGFGASASGGFGAPSNFIAPSGGFSVGTSDTKKRQIVKATRAK